MEFFKAFFFLLYEYNEKKQLDSNNFEKNNHFINLNRIFLSNLLWYIYKEQKKIIK